MFLNNLDGLFAEPPMKRSMSLSLSKSPHANVGPLVDCLFGKSGWVLKSSNSDSKCLMLFSPRLTYIGGVFFVGEIF